MTEADACSASGLEGLRWRRATFTVMRREALSLSAPFRQREVTGIVAGPFGIHRSYETAFQLSHVPTARHIATLPKQRDCKALAEKLAPLRVAWEETDPEKVVQGQPDQPAVANAVMRAQLDAKRNRI